MRLNGLMNMMQTSSATIVSSLVMLILTPLITIKYGHENYALITLFFTVIAQISILDLGLPKIIVPKISKNEPFLGFLLQVFIIFCLVLISIFYFANKIPFFIKFFQGINLYLIISVSLLTFLMSSVRSVLEGIKFVRYSILSKNLDYVIQLSALYFIGKSDSFDSSIIVYLTIQVLHLFFLILIITKNGFLNFNIIFKNKNEFKIGILLMFSSLIGPFLTSFERYTWKYDENLITLASYSLAFTVASRMFMFSSVLQPFLYVKFAKETIILKECLNTATIIFRLITIIFLLIIPYLIPLWLGLGYKDEIPVYFKLILIGVYFNCLARIPYDYLIIVGQTKKLSLMHFSELVIIVPLLLLFRENDILFIYLVSLRYFIEYIILLIFSKEKNLLIPFRDLVIISILIFMPVELSSILLIIMFMYLIYNFFKFHFNELQSMFSE
tara:strand:+ start:1998 stop:3323 length:1326 start_codon:yes stop_codon:yes gene_type:complete